MKYESMNQQASKEVIEKEKEALGLNKSFTERYANWLFAALKGDFGTSVKYSVPVTQKLGQAIPNTVSLVFVAIILTVIFALLLGILSAVWHNTIADNIIRFISFIGISMPSFWLGLLLIYWFSIRLKILPTSGMGEAKHMILPSVTLAVWSTSAYIRRIRAGLLEEMKKNYVTGLLSRGVSYKRIIWNHVLPNSLIGVLTMFAMTVGGMLGGTIVVENIFAWQGVGKLAMEAISNRDYPIIQAYVVWMALIYVGINFLVDILNRLIDPRMRIGG
jgi:dipeptide transport system permease dppB